MRQKRKSIRSKRVILLDKVRDLSIRTRIIVSSSLTLVLITLFVIWYYPAQEKDRIIATMHNHDHKFAEMLALGCGQGMAIGDFSLVAEAMDWAKMDSNLACILIYDENGELLTSYNPDSLQFDTDAEIDGTDCLVNLGEQALHLTSTPITYHLQSYGTLVMATSLESVQAGIRENRRTTLIISLIVLLLGIAISLLFGHMITKPIVQLKEAAEAVAGGDTDVSVVVNSRDEVGVLAGVFNEMVGNVRGAMVAIREKEQKYRSIFETAPNLIISVDISGVIIECNLRAQEVLGFLPGDLIGKSIESLMHPDCIREGRRGMRRVIEKGCEFNKEYRMLRSDGAIIDVSINSSVVADDDGKITGAIHIIDDITQRKKASEEARVLAERLEKAERMESLGMLAGGVAHDLNNMLGPLVAYPDMILEDLPADSPIRNIVAIMGKAANRAATVIQDLLTLARRGRYEMELVDLSDVVTTFLNSPAFLSIRDNNSAVKVEIDLDPEAKITGSAAHLEKVIMNLVVNACDAMPEGGTLQISVGRATDRQLAEAYKRMPPGEYIVLSVSDTGTGIDPKDLDKIFEPYYSKKKMGKSGSGLGLSVVYGIVKDHHGYYDVFSEVGVGTRFVLYFPATDRKEQSDSRSMDSFEGHERILVVDDVEEQRGAASTILKRFGYEVACVSGGREALEYLKEKPVDLVVLDMIMEDGFDGLDTFKAARQICPDLKVVIVSGYSPTERVELMRAMGAGPYVRKPFSREALGRAVRQELDREIDKQKAESSGPSVSSAHPAVTSQVISCQ